MTVSPTTSADCHRRSFYRQRVQSHVRPCPSAVGPAVSYHAVFHDHAKFGGHAYSEDALVWTYSTEVPFDNEVRNQRDEMRGGQTGVASSLWLGWSGRARLMCRSDNEVVYTTGETVLLQVIRSLTAARELLHSRSKEPCCCTR